MKGEEAPVDELDEGLKLMAEKLMAEALAASPAGNPYPHRRLFSDSVATKLVSQFAVRNPFYDQKRHDEYLAREAAMSRWAKARRRLRFGWIELRYRLTYALRHLRGIECPNDY